MTFLFGKPSIPTAVDTIDRPRAQIHHFFTHLMNQPFTSTDLQGCEIQKWFPDYDGGKDVSKGRKYFKKKFLDLNKFAVRGDKLSLVAWGVEFGWNKRKMAMVL